MWKGCMANNPKDWRDMKRYNKQDVDLLEKLYLRFRPWIKTHPAAEGGSVCPKCGSKKLIKRGFSQTKANYFRRFQCKGCGGWTHAAKPEGKRAYMVSL